MSKFNKNESRIIGGIELRGLGLSFGTIRFLQDHGIVSLRSLLRKSEDELRMLGMSEHMLGLIKIHFRNWNLEWVPAADAGKNS